MNEMCRLCLITSENLDCRLSENSEMLLKLKTCFGLEILLTDSLPRNLCVNCLKKVEEMYNFRQQIVENEHKLKEMIKNNPLDINLDVKIKVEDIEPDLDIKQELDFYNDDSLTYNEAIQKINKKSHKSLKKENKRLKIKKKDSKISKSRQKRVKITFENDINTIKCVTCFKVYETRIDLLSHYKTDHSLTDQFVDENQSVSDDKFTILSKDDESTYKCNSCGDVYSDKEQMVQHIVNHMKERPFVCKLCGKTYKSIYEIVRHGRVHSGSKLLCSFGCGYSSPHGGAMRDHERRHNNDHTYKCQICGKGFLVKTWFDQHQNIHNNIKPFKCDVCTMDFHMHRYLMAHRSKMHPDVSAIRRYTCLQCSYTCDSKKAFDEHSMEHKSNSEMKIKHLCDVCGKAFSRVDCLKNHKNSHFGIKPFTCSICNKQFAKKFNLKVHERVHNNDTSSRQQCNTCGKLFSQKSTLHRHRKRRHPDDINKNNTNETCTYNENK